ncbi:MAG TPA: ribbon-helix-helix protein, CopG family [Candidatus Binatia bacterium]|jgi:hypothetical protein|nr:ribbon-helix-helix protein, CopG family [Candidatus Binatia bacterium]
MIRTQIYLPQQQHDRLKDLALKQRTSMSDVIRQIVDEKIVTSNQAASTKPKKLNTGEWLLVQARLAEKLDFRGPSDLASNMDEYLYG